MLDNVLRGFCKKCEENIILDLINEHSEPIWVIIPSVCLKNSNTVKKIIKPHEPVWFLSPKQLIIVSDSREFHLSVWRDNAYGISKFLENEPFLVAMILKQAGEKKEETYVDGTRIKSYNEQVSSAPKIVIDRAVNITKNPDALFDVALSDEEWKKKYPSTPKEKNSKEENK